ncbi:MAG: hypothetical protein FWF92_05875 [Oscillospiraceae bacterium]|nr:hypothetical protein [Oscillospiraceae bacterium]
MFKTLKEWFDFENEPIGENAKWYEKTLDCIQQIDAGETTIDDKRAEMMLIWFVVNFINTQDNESEEENKYKLQDCINLYFMIFKRMSDLTYREIIDLFPVRIRCEDDIKYFGADDIPEFTDSEDSGCGYICEFFGEIGLVTLCSCGLHFGDETEGTTDFDSKIGDNIMEYAANCSNPDLGLFYNGFICAAHNLCFYD